MDEAVVKYINFKLKISARFSRMCNIIEMEERIEMLQVARLWSSNRKEWKETKTQEIRITERTPHQIRIVNQTIQ